MEKLIRLLTSMGIKFDESFNGVYQVEENNCRLALDNWFDDESQVLSIEYIDSALDETIFEVTLNSDVKPVSITYAGEDISEDEFEDELEERFN